MAEYIKYKDTEIKTELLDGIALLKALKEEFGANYEAKINLVIPNWKTIPVNEWGINLDCTYAELAKTIKRKWNKLKKKTSLKSK